MITLTHMPGPWHTCTLDGDATIFSGGINIAEVCSGEAEYLYNAQLISAAPDLLDALQELDKRLRTCLTLAGPVSAADAYDNFYQEMVAEAIAKAIGGVA